GGRVSAALGPFLLAPVSRPRGQHGCGAAPLSAATALSPARPRPTPDARHAPAVDCRAPGCLRPAPGFSADAGRGPLCRRSPLDRCLDCQLHYLAYVCWSTAAPSKAYHPNSVQADACSPVAGLECLQADLCRSLGA